MPWFCDRAGPAVSLNRLGLAFDDLKKDAAPGVDGVRWREY